MLKRLFSTKPTLFIPFIMAGHPSEEDSLKAIITLSESGADMIELGVPFSDPVADGPVNQHAAEIALQQGVTLDSVLEIVRQVRAQGNTTPIIIFTYLNPLLSMGYEKFILRAKASGVDGILIVDLPPEEGQELYTLLKNAGLEFVLLASPTTDRIRFELYQQLDPAFLYYISRLSVTGIQNTLALPLEAEIKALRTALPTMNIAVGFGISNAEQATKVAQFADGVIIGSMLVQTLEEQGLSAFRQLAAEFAQAILAPPQGQ